MTSKSIYLRLLLVLLILVPAAARAQTAPPEIKQYSLWNGFIDLVDILEITNNSDVARSATVRMYDITGRPGNPITVALAAGEQRDLILNQFSEFRRESYGLVEVTGSEAIQGRLVFYRTAAASTGFGSGGGKQFDFVYSLPLSTGRLGDSSVSFNTFGMTAADGGELQVVNWLSLVNIDPDRSLDLVLRKRDSAGAMVQDRTIRLQPKQRVDVEAGHVLPGANHAGSITVIPSDDAVPYLAHNIRYAIHHATSTDNAGHSQFGFAIPFIAVTGTPAPMALGVRTNQAGVPVQNWLELTNLAASDNAVALTFRGPDGRAIANGPVRIVIASKAQSHFDARGLLATAGLEFGTVEIDAEKNILADSLVYAQGTGGSGIASAYAVQGYPITSIANGTSVSWNRFLGMSNLLTLHNPSSSPVAATATVFKLNTRVRELNFELAPKQTKRWIVDEATFGAAADSYGRIELGGPVVPELLRSRSFQSTGETYVDFLHAPSPSGSWYFSSGTDNPSSPIYGTDRVYVFIVSGQSNATGPTRGAEFQPAAEDANILFAYRVFKGGLGVFANHREAVENPDNWTFSSPLVTTLELQRLRAGPEIAFARRIYRSSLCDGRPCAGRKVAIIKYAVGGSHLAVDWLGTGDNDARLKQRSFEFIGQSLERLKERGLKPKVQALVWVQGESDTTTDAMANAYEQNLTTFLADLRNAVQTPAMLATIAKLRDDWTGNAAVLARAHIVQAAQDAVDAADPRSVVFETEGLPKLPDQPVHFSPAGSDGLGDRAFAALRELYWELF